MIMFLQLNAFIKKLKEIAEFLLKVSEDNFKATVTLFILTDFSKATSWFLYREYNLVEWKWCN